MASGSSICFRFTRIHLACSIIFLLFIWTGDLVLEATGADAATAWRLLLPLINTVEDVLAGFPGLLPDIGLLFRLAGDIGAQGRGHERPVLLPAAAPHEGLGLGEAGWAGIFLVSVHH